MNPVAWFEIPVTDMERAMRFYEGVFGVTLTPSELGPLEMAFFPMEDGSYGASGALTAAEGYVPAQTGVLIYFSTPDIDASLKKIKNLGGKAVLGKTPIGPYGFVGHFLDTEGNRLALHTPPQM